jgi:deoxyribonuclease-4
MRWSRWMRWMSILPWDRTYSEVVYANDSRDPCGAPRDRHWHIGEGTIGDAGFAALLAHPVLAAVPWITELPETNADHARNLARLRRLADSGCQP